MGEETIGILSSIPRVSRVLVSTSDGTTAEYLGTRSTSSKVIPVATIFPSMRPPWLRIAGLEKSRIMRPRPPKQQRQA